MNWGKFTVEMLALNGCLLLGFIMGRMLGFFKGWQKGFKIGLKCADIDTKATTSFIEEIQGLLDKDIEQAKERINNWAEFEKSRAKMLESKMGPASE